MIGHRGASGYRPEHTLASYELAARMGADYVEPDLITDTTNVADHPEFAGKRTTKTIDGTPQSGWFTDDFTLAELRTLRAKKFDVPLVELFDARTLRPYDFVVSGDTRTYGDLATPKGLRGVARYADGVGPSKIYIVPRDAAGNSLPPTALVGGPERLRRRDRRGPAFLQAGVDGIFTDTADIAVEARKELLERR